MKILHLSDLHYANETLVEVDRCTGAAIDRAMADAVDIAVVSGDATDHGIDVHAPAFVALAKQIHFRPAAGRERIVLARLSGHFDAAIDREPDSRRAGAPL